METDTDICRQPELYRLATRALYDLTRADVDPASQLLKALPDPKASFAGGWLFDYGVKPGCRGEPKQGKQWSFRSAHKIDTSWHAWDRSQEVREEPDVFSSAVNSDNVADEGSDDDDSLSWNEAEDMDIDSNQP